MGPHFWGTLWVLALYLAAARCQTEEDEKRPYKFAFAIEGYQHRSEEKDERGIIMGEFGFVTGDGVYHVTVYATDENGDFKILSMKNFYIGLPGEGTTVAPTKAPTRPPPPTSTKSAIQQHLDGLKGCGGCIVPDKKNGQSVGGKGVTPSKGVDDIDIRFGNRPGSSGGPVKPGVPGVTGGKPTYNTKPSGGAGNQPFGGGGPFTTAPKESGPAFGSQGNKNPPGNFPQGGSPQYNNPAGGTGSQYPQSPGKGTPQDSSGNRFGQPPPTGGGSTSGFGGSSTSPGRLGVQQNQGTGETPGGRKPSQPGSPQYSDGLPPGMTMEDLTALLYKFNYTLKYHGHHESGYRSGDKEGGYFFNGRDGLGRDVKYLANEFGFQPNITLVDLGLQAPDTPKEVNEEPNELRGNEFKWFYQR